MWIFKYTYLILWFLDQVYLRGVNILFRSAKWAYLFGILTPAVQDVSWIIHRGSVKFCWSSPKIQIWKTFCNFLLQGIYTCFINYIYCISIYYHAWLFICLYLRKPVSSHAWHKWHNQTQMEVGTENREGVGHHDRRGSVWNTSMPPSPMYMKDNLSENRYNCCELYLLNRYKMHTLLYKFFTHWNVYIMMILHYTSYLPVCSTETILYFVGC